MRSDPSDLKKALQIVIDAQLGLITSKQAADHGFGPSRVRSRIDTGEWISVLRGVYSVVSGPLTRVRELQAALLFAGAGSMLSHQTAAESWGWLRPVDNVDERLPIQVTVPVGRSAKGQGSTLVRPNRTGSHLVLLAGTVLHPGVTVHRSRAVQYIGVDFEFPLTTKADTALDIAVSQPTAADAARSLVASVTNAKIPVKMMRAKLELRRPQRYAKILVEAVDLIASGVQSVLEERYATQVEQAHGLPTARRQSPVIVDGQTLYEDVDYSACGVPLIVRLDGRRFHLLKTVTTRDRRRENAAELAGRPSLAFGYDEVNQYPCQVAAEVRFVLERDGWKGPPGSCVLCVSLAS